MSNPLIKHKTETIPGIVRSEIYELDDLKYVERFDEETGKRLLGEITMYDGVCVCRVNADGAIYVTLPTDWVTNHRGMMSLIEDIKRLDAFMADVCQNYH
jgi:hypothetical protein